MIAVIFEVVPAGEKEKLEYLSIAGDLKSILINMDGFMSIERFQSLSDSDKILSLSFWKDEESIKNWRNVEMHRLAQQKGRSDVFKDYRLRIADVVRDYGMFERNDAPADSREFHTQKSS